MYAEFIIIYVLLSVAILMLGAVLFLLIKLLMGGNKSVGAVSYQQPQYQQVQYQQVQYQQPQYQQVQPGSVVFCQRCATQYDASQAYCPKCGTRR